MDIEPIEAMTIEALAKVVDHTPLGMTTVIVPLAHKGVVVKNG